jgi:hypothetical protein
MMACSSASRPRGIGGTGEVGKVVGWLRGVGLLWADSVPHGLVPSWQRPVSPRL